MKYLLSKLRLFAENFKSWASKSNFNSILAGAISVIIIAVPFILTIFGVVTFIDNETVYMTLSLLSIIAFGVSYYFYVKFMNKL